MKKFFVSRNIDDRIDYIKSIPGKTFVIYNKKTDLVDMFDYSADMNKLMDNDYFFEKIVKCDMNVTLILLDVLVKHGIYVHPYGKIFRFTEVAKQTLIIDSFFFRFDEKFIVRPFLFIDTSVFGTSMINFHRDPRSTIENYHPAIAPYVLCKDDEIKVNTIRFTPTEKSVDDYEELKKELIFEKQAKKNSIVNQLIKFVDALPEKREAIDNYIDKGNTHNIIIESNLPKTKFDVYNMLADDSQLNEITFVSSGVFGADEIELDKTKRAIVRHNELIRLINNG